jgi:hypothetical protein
MSENAVVWHDMGCTLGMSLLALAQLTDDLEISGMALGDVAHLAFVRTLLSLFVLLCSSRWCLPRLRPW